MQELFNREEDRVQEILNLFTAAAVESCDQLDSVLSGHHIHTIVFAYRCVMFAVTFFRKRRGSAERNENQDTEKAKRPDPEKRLSKNDTDNFDCET